MVKYIPSFVLLSFYLSLAQADNGAINPTKYKNPFSEENNPECELDGDRDGEMSGQQSAQLPNVVVRPIKRRIIHHHDHRFTSFAIRLPE